MLAMMTYKDELKNVREVKYANPNESGNETQKSILEYDPDCYEEIPHELRAGQSNVVLKAEQEKPTKFVMPKQPDRQPD